MKTTGPNNPMLPYHWDQDDHLVWDWPGLRPGAQIQGGTD